MSLDNIIADEQRRIDASRDAAHSLLLYIEDLINDHYPIFFEEQDGAQEARNAMTDAQEAILAVKEVLERPRYEREPPQFRKALAIGLIDMQADEEGFLYTPTQKGMEALDEYTHLKERIDRPGVLI